MVVVQPVGEFVVGYRRERSIGAALRFGAWIEIVVGCHSR